MSAENCPFEIIRSDEKDEDRRKHKDKYVNFEVKLGEDENAPTVSQEIRLYKS